MFHPPPNLGSNYPHAAYRGLLNAMMQYLMLWGIDPAMTGAQLCAFVSLLTQGVGDVCWPNGERMPIGVPVLCVAPSSSGKSLIYRLLMRAIEAYLDSVEWTHKEIGKPQFVVEDATLQALIDFVAKWPILGLFTEEGGQTTALFKSSQATLAKLLDAARVRHIRRGIGSIELQFHRVTALLLEQPDVFEGSKSLLGTSNSGVGLANRLLVVTATSMPDAAQIHGIPPNPELEAQWGDRCVELLKMTIANVVARQRELPCVRMSPEATEFFIWTDEEAKRFAHSPEGSRARNYIIRHAARVLKLEGALHVFANGPDDCIELDTVRSADAIARHSIDDFMRLTYEPPKVTKAEVYAQQLEGAITYACQVTNFFCVKVKDLKTIAPNYGLTKGQVDAAIPVLCLQGKVSVTRIGRDEVINVNPSSFLTGVPRIGRWN